MENDFVLRSAKWTDLPSLLGIYNEVVQTSTALYEEETRTLDQQKLWFREKENSKFPIFVGVWKGTVIGYGTYGPFRQWQCYRPTVELGLHLTEKARGRGFGSQILALLIEDARRCKFHTMIAGIDSKNEASLKLHLKFGFKHAGELKEVGYKFGRWLDLVFMQLLLSGPNDNSSYK